MRKFKSIGVTLENCEHYTIPAKCIDKMLVDGFKTRYFIQGDYGDCSKYLRAYYFKLSLKNTNEIIPSYDFSKPFNERIHTGGDITSITIEYENNKSFSFYVPWNYKDQQYNSWQIVKKNDDGYIDIEIKKPKNV